LEKREMPRSALAVSIAASLAALLACVLGCGTNADFDSASLPALPPPSTAPSDSQSHDETPAAGNAEEAAGAAEALLDPALPNYTPAEGVSGTIKSVGSDTMNNLMTLWQEGFRRFYPSIKIEIEGKGSSSAPPALIEGTAAFGPMSREMKESEIDGFKAKFGYPPTELATSLDMLAVYVHKDNPIESLTFPQVDAIFSKLRKLGYPNDIRTWGEVGLTGEWANQPISLYGRNPASGTYGYFKEHVLGNGDYKDTVKQQPGSSSVVQAVGHERYAVGYSGIGYKTADVRAVPLAEGPGAAPVEAAPKNAYSGDYPLARPLLVYLNYKPGAELDPLRREFIKYIFSRQGQSDVVKDGYLPVTAENAKEALLAVGIGQP
jgi:phosphate transport system substrate-binding protein